MHIYFLILFTLISCTTIHPFEEETYQKPPEEPVRKIKEKTTIKEKKEAKQTKRKKVEIEYAPATTKPELNKDTQDHSESLVASTPHLANFSLLPLNQSSLGS